MMSPKNKMRHKIHKWDLKKRCIDKKLEKMLYSIVLKNFLDNDLIQHHFFFRKR